MADTLPLPQYSLPTQGLPQGLDVAAAVPPNALSQVGPGIVQGASLGFQARQTAALEQERQTQLMSAQLAAQQAQKQNNILALQAVGEQYDRLAKNHPDTAFDMYQSKMAPLMSAVLRDHGIQADFQTEANPEHETADKVKRIHDLVSGLADGSIDMPHFQKGMNQIQSENNIGDYVQKRVDEAQKAGNSVNDYQKHQDELEQQFSQEISATKSRSGGYGQQDQKVDQAIHLRSLANQYYDPKTGNYNVPLAQYKEMVLGLANLVSASGAADVETRKDLESATSYSQLNKFVQTATGKPQTGNTQAVIKNLIDSTDRQGTVAQNLRDNYLSQIEPNQSLEPQRAQRQIGKGRGADFNEYLPGGKNGPKTAPTTPEAYLASIHAKVTPKNIAWAKSQMESNGK